MNMFGKPTHKSMAHQILNSPSLTSLPSPEIPKTIPKDSTAKHYAHLLYTLYQLRSLETDPINLHQISDFISFADKQYSELALNEDELSNLAPPPPPPAPMPNPMPNPQPNPLSALLGQGQPPQQ